MAIKILSWKRAQWSHRDFFLFPDEDEIIKHQCTATKCVIIDPEDKKILLTHTQRWWEIPGWHTESWESLEQTTIREVREETWVLLSEKDISLMWYMHITNTIPRFRKQTGDAYPRISYILYYFCIKKIPLIQTKPQGTDAISAWLFSFTDPCVTESEQHPVILVFLWLYSTFYVMPKKFNHGL